LHLLQANLVLHSGCSFNSVDELNLITLDILIVLLLKIRAITNATDRLGKESTQLPPPHRLNFSKLLEPLLLRRCRLRTTYPDACHRRDSGPPTQKTHHYNLVTIVLVPEGGTSRITTRAYFNVPGDWPSVPDEMGVGL
jgi:hypothetical protein